LLIFAVGETIYLNGLDIRDEIFHKSLLISNMYRTNIIYIGISLHQYKNFSARCILYGSSNNSISNHRRLLRLLYILISCGMFLLSLIICSIINDRRRAKFKQQLEQEMMDNRHTIVPKKSMPVFIDKDRKSSSRRGDINRMTMARLSSMVDERPSAVHSFSQTPK
jgi:RNA recognition motif-containing protein